MPLQSIANSYSSYGRDHANLRSHTSSLTALGRVGCGVAPSGEGLYYGLRLAAAAAEQDEDGLTLDERIRVLRNRFEEVSLTTGKRREDENASSNGMLNLDEQIKAFRPIAENPVAYYKAPFDGSTLQPLRKAHAQILRDQRKVLLQRSGTIAFMTSGYINPFREHAKHFAGGIVLADEGGQLDTLELVNAAQAAQRLIVAGDWLQLPPYAEARRKDATELTESLLSRARASTSMCVLNRVYRLHPQMARFLATHYRTPEGEGVLSQGWTQKAIRFHFIHAVSPFNPVTIFNLRAPAIKSKDGQSSSNEQEVRLVLYWLGCLDQGLMFEETRERMEVAVLTPYADQVELLQRYIQPHSADWAALKVSVLTIDKAAGRDVEASILSLVASSHKDSHTKITSFWSDERFNVAVSRAKFLTAVVGDAQLYKKKGTDKLMRQFFRDGQDLGFVTVDVPTAKTRELERIFL